MNIYKREYFTIILAFLLLIIILVSKNTINLNNNNNFFYILIIVNLLIIISCLIDLSNRYTETFLNLVKNKRCYRRSKEYDSYNYKIDSRLQNLRNLEEKDRKEKIYKDEELKFKELKIMNDDYLINGELFE